MKSLVLVLAVAALVTGLVAASNWYAASRVHPKPNWTFEPVEPTLKQMGWDVATLEAFDRAGRRNATAALWTAASVVLSAASAMLSAWSS